MPSINGISIQEELTSGVNLKSLNSTSLLGSGDLVVNQGFDGFQFCEIIPSNGTSVSSSTANTITYSALIPAYTFASGGILELIARIQKSGQNATIRSFIYTNTSNSLTGATLIGSPISGSTTIQYAQYQRIFRLTNNRLYGLPFIRISSNDNEFLNQQFESETSFDVSVDNYILISVQLGTAVNTTFGTFLKLLGYE